jgi:HD-like signal output (HDOD) protein
VNKRHPERIGKMLLGEWKLDASVLHQASFFRSRKKMQEQIGRALQRRTAAEAQKMLVDKLLLARRKPGDIESQGRKPATRISISPSST